MFLDTDPRNFIYWLGYDYVVRGVEWSPATNTFVTRQITLDPTTPGGWGPQSGSAAFTQKPRSFEVAIPLAAVSGIESTLEYCVETYATISCPDCGAGLTHEWADDYFATLGDIRRHDVVAGTSVPRSAYLMASPAPQAGHRADADLRLAARISSAR